MTRGGRRVLDFPSQGWHLGRYLARASVSRPSGGVLRRHHGRTVCRSSLRAETRKQGLAIDSRRASAIHLRLRRSCEWTGRCWLRKPCCGCGDGVCRDAAVLLRSWPEAGVVGDSLRRYLDSCLRWRLLFSGVMMPPRSVEQ